MPAPFPQTDPTPLFELFRGIHATELLTAAVAHFRLFEVLGHGPLPDRQLRDELGLAPRPFVVLTTALWAMGLVRKNSTGNFQLTELAEEHLVPNLAFDVSGYVGLAAENPSVLGMVERLRTNRPYGAEPKSDSGTAFIFREGTTSAMEQEASARRLTMSLAGRAKNVAPYFAEAVDASTAATILDVGGGTGIYAYALLAKYPHLKAIVLDRPEVLKTAAECASDWQVADRVSLLPGDMFQTEFPSADLVLLSNVLHDWDIAECEALVAKSALATSAGGRVLIHDVFLNDELDGPLPVALYSASLFSLTEGRAYSAAEYRGWLKSAGLDPQPVVPTLVHCGVLGGLKR